MKRLVCILAALQVCVMSSFAWSAESFVGNDYDHYNQMEAAQVSDLGLEDSGVSPDQSAALTIEPRAGMDDDGVGTLYDLDLTAPTSVEVNLNESTEPGLRFGLFCDYTFYLPSTGTSYDLVGLAGELTTGIPTFNDNGNTTFDYYGFSGTNVPFDANQFNQASSGNTFQGWSMWQSCGVVARFDVPVPADTYGISFTPDLSIFGRSSFRGTSTDRYSAFGKLLINGEEYLNFSNEGYNNPGYTKESTFTFSSPIQSCELVLYTTTAQFKVGLPANSQLSGSGTWWHRLFIRDASYAKFGFLSQDPALGLQNNMTQNDINDHTKLESEWTSSMTENFDSLNISNFTYPSGLVSAFALISGIFNDLWNCLGEYRILYVMPLTLGIVLVVCGKMSRTSGFLLEDDED